jgi:hypothetical protein
MDGGINSNVVKGSAVNGRIRMVNPAIAYVSDDIILQGMVSKLGLKDYKIINLYKSVICYTSPAFLKSIEGEYNITANVSHLCDSPLLEDVAKKIVTGNTSDFAVLGAEGLLASLCSPCRIGAGGRPAENGLVAVSPASPTTTN